MTQRLVSIVLTLCWLCTPGLADQFPTRPITFVVPFAAGGPLDTLGRTVAQRMSQRLGQTIVIENVAGAGGTLGVQRVVDAPADGYTLGVGNWSTHVLNGAIYTLRYDLVRDLEPIALLPSAPQIILARKDIQAATLGELIGWIRDHGATLGTAGVGSAGHVSAVLFEKRIGTQLTLVHYRGNGPALSDLIGGHIDVMFDQSITALPHVRDGLVKAFAVTTAQRLAAAPDIPTTDEAGLPDFHVAVWSGLWAPKGTPARVIEAISAAARDALSDPGLREKFGSVGLGVPPPEQVGPQGLAAAQQADISKWWPILKAASIRTE